MTSPSSVAGSWDLDQLRRRNSSRVGRIFESPLFKLLTYVPQHKKYAALTVLFGVLGFLLSFVYPWIIGAAIDLVTGAGNTQPLAARHQRLIVLTEFALATGILHAVVLYGRGHFNARLGEAIVSDLRRGPEPWFVLTGDTLFVGAVGRPDLPGRAQENAGQLFDSIHAKLLPLPGDVEVYPAHFAGSACGAGMSGKPSSTIAFEKRWNALLSKPRDEFVDALSDVPPKPAAMDQILRVNQGREGLP